MPEVNLSLTKWWHWLTAAVATLGPIIAAAATLCLWVDTRYMHRNISDTRHIDTQIMVVQGHLRDYARIIDAGGELSTQDKINFDLDKIRLQHLTTERNKLLGIGDLPQ
mgnify:CR=1 FL=1